NDTYVLANVAVSAAATWKIAGAAWGDVYNFGDATGIEFDTPVVLSASSNSGNCTLAAGGDDVTFTFVLSTKTLTVKNNGVIIAPTAPELYLRGSMGGTAWPALPEWKFTTTDDDTYVLSGVSVTAADTWKIADAEWGSYNYGGIQGISLNEEVTLVYDGDNCSLAVDGTDLTFTFVLSTKTLKVTGKGTEPIDPPVGDYRTLYLVGEMTDWKLDEAYEMTRTNNVYTITLADGLTGAWKIWDGTWDYSFGVGEQPEVGVETDCWFNSTDFTVNTTGKTTVTLTLVEGSDVADTSVPSKILIQGEAVDPEPVSAPEKLYLVGDTTGWEVSDAFLMTRNDNVYTLKLADGITGEWKIWDGTWNFSFGAGEEQPVLGKETDVWFKSSNNFTLNHDSATEIIFTLVEGSYEAGSSVPATLLVKKDNSGVSDVEVDAAPAKFYNLQGVEVANPENGLFIEVRGNAVRKVVR
ncbi:MAG: hypothetical protein K2M19_06780, partial [Muribaculaceae bacterium]|nr:hypothetical protein [Muribaculaceae bacterium]